MRGEFPLSFQEDPTRCAASHTLTSYACINNRIGTACMHMTSAVIDAARMPSRVYVTVGCPSVRPSVPSIDSISGWFAAERGRMQQISIDSRYAAPALSRKCGQRLVESGGTRLNTDVLNEGISSLSRLHTYIHT